MRTTLQGVVLKVSPKTAVVRVEHWREHKLYHKKYKTHKKFHANFKDLELGAGDLVEIVEIPRSSRTKFFKVTKILSKGER